MAPRYYKSDWIRSGKASEFLTMAKSADTISTKSSIISGKAASLKKTVKKSTKAITQPFKNSSNPFLVIWPHDRQSLVHHPQFPHLIMKLMATIQSLLLTMGVLTAAANQRLN